MTANLEIANLGVILCSKICKLGQVFSKSPLFSKSRAQNRFIFEILGEKVFKDTIEETDVDQSDSLSILIQSWSYEHSAPDL